MELIQYVECALQWGRTPRGAETHRGAALDVVQPSFNGAAPHGVRKLGGHVDMDMLIESLQWGRTPRGAETAAYGTGGTQNLSLQWGRTPRGAETTPRRQQAVKQR